MKWLFTRYRGSFCQRLPCTVVEVSKGGNHNDPEEHDEQLQVSLSSNAVTSSS